MRIPLQQYWTLLARYLAPQRGRIVALVALLVGEIALQLTAPQLVRAFLDTATAGGSLNALLTTAALFLGAGVVGHALMALSSYVGANIGWVATNGLRADLAEHCLRLDVSFHHAHTPGELIERLDGDIRELSNFFSQFAVQLLASLLLLFGVLALLLIEDWRVGTVFVVFVVLTLVVFNRVRHVASPYWAAARQASAALYGFVEERLGGLPDLRANGATGYIKRRFAEAARTQFRHNRTAIAMGVVVGNGSKLLLALGSLGALAAGAALYLNGSMTIGTVYLITAYARLINWPLQALIRQIDDLQRASASIARIEELTRLQSIVRDGPGVDFGVGPLAVAFEEVTFWYDERQESGVGDQGTERHGDTEIWRHEGKEIEIQEDRMGKTNLRSPISNLSFPISDLQSLVPNPQLTLNDISFALAPGEVLGLIGRTGSGKTTLTRLLLRLYDPSSGAIMLNGADIRAAKLADLRRRIGIVTQDVQLFRASVRDNLTLFDASIDDDRIVAVLCELGLDAWHTALPNGLGTPLGASGSGLSAGEAQLLAVARIFLRDPGLVILDEASSRLDPATERLLDRAFDKLLANRTAIVIAHRLRTVQRADTILLLEDGCVREYGPRVALANDSQSTFFRLLQLGLEDFSQ